MLDFIKIIRPLNLFIIVITQVIIYYFLVWQAFDENNITAALDSKLLFLFILDTVIIAAGGYVINDIKDKDIDIVNKPRKTYIGHNKINISSAWNYYFILNGIGLAIAIFIGYEIDRPLLIIIFPIAVGLLVLYSFIWKSRPLIGNIIVSLFCAFVPGIIWIAEKKGFDELVQYNLPSAEKTLFLLFSFSIFSFFANLIREMIKDFEDKEGDLIAGANTLPIAIGMQRAYFLVLVTSITQLLFTAAWINTCTSIEGINQSYLWTISALLLIPLFYIIFSIYRVYNTHAFGKISFLLKCYMGIGLLALVTLSI